MTFKEQLEAITGKQINGIYTIHLKSANEYLYFEEKEYPQNLEDLMNLIDRKISSIKDDLIYNNECYDLD